MGTLQDGGFCVGLGVTVVEVDVLNHEVAGDYRQLELILKMEKYLSFL